MAKLKYNLEWPNGTPDLEIEKYMIQQGKDFLKLQGRSLFFHYREFFKIAWPEDDHHRWSDLILKSFCENDLLVILGCSDSSKTDTMAKIALSDYWCFPDKTLWLVSTTEGRGAELRVWGHMKDLFNRAIRAGHSLAGHPIDHMKTITSGEIDEDGEMARSLKRGLIVVPCKSGGTSSGLGSYIGIKAPRLRHCGDEVQVMNENFLHAYSNWYGKEDFKGMMAGNFMETDDPLGIASEPEDGWDSFVDSGKTQEWRSRFYDAKVIALDGRDSPNFDQPGEPKFKYLIGQKKLDGVAKTKGTDSWEWYSQCVGKPVKGMDIWRVLTKGFCEQHHALEEVVWTGAKTTKIYGLDPAYGNGDRCVGREIEFGPDVNGVEILRVGPPEIIPIKLNANEAEEQIAMFVKARLDGLGIPYENCFFDSFGRGTLSFQFARLMGNNTPVPVDSGARPSARPVRFDLFVDEGREKRLKRCDEHYTKGISEYWFSVREAIESNQVRNLDMETIREGQSRKFTKNNQAKIEVEPKDDMKKRLGKSPDFFDCFIGETLISTTRGDIPIKDVVVGDFVITPFGNREVVLTHVQEVNNLTKVLFSNRLNLTGKGSHRVFVKSKGWVRLDNVSIDMEMESKHDLPLWNILNLFFTRVENTGFKQLADIISLERTGKLKRRDFYIGLSGLSAWEAFLKACASIIKMVIGLITELKIWNSLTKKFTPEIIFKNAFQIPALEGIGLETNQSHCLKLQNGTDRKMVKNGIQPTERGYGNREEEIQGSSRASFARRILQHPAFRFRYFAQTGVCKNRLVFAINAIKEFAWYAARNLSPSNTGRQKIVPVNVVQFLPIKPERVYNLSVLDVNVFYANGVLVENCLSICVEGARQRGFQIKRIGENVKSSKPIDYFESESKAWSNAISAGLLKR